MYLLGMMKKHVEALDHMNQLEHVHRDGDGAGSSSMGDSNVFGMK